MVQVDRSLQRVFKVSHSLGVGVIGRHDSGTILETGNH